MAEELNLFEEGVLSSGRDEFFQRRREGSTAIRELEENEPELRGDLQIDQERGNTVVEPNQFLEDDEFDAFRSAVSESETVRFDPGIKENVVQSEAAEQRGLPPDPREVHSSRSENAQRVDERRDAPITLDPAEYARRPGELDFPGVDEGPRAREIMGNMRGRQLERIEEAERGERDSIIGDELLL